MEMRDTVHGNLLSDNHLELIPLNETANDTLSDIKIQNDKSRTFLNILGKGVLIVLIVLFFSLLVTIISLLVIKKFEPLKIYYIQNASQSQLEQNLTVSCPQQNSSIPCPKENCSSTHCSRGNCSKNYSNCKTAGCYSYAAQLLGSLDTTVNPCDNFYQYACDKWIDKAEIHDTQVEQQGFVQQSVITNKRLREILESTSRHSPTLTKPRIAYNACIKHNENETYYTLSKLINSSNVGWPVFEGPNWRYKHSIYNFDDLLKSLVTLRQEGWIEGVLFKTFVYEDPYNNTDTILTLSPPERKRLSDKLSPPEYKRLSDKLSPPEDKGLSDDLFVKLVTVTVWELSNRSVIDIDYVQESAMEMIKIRDMIQMCLDTPILEYRKTMTIEKFTVLTQWGSKKIDWLSYFNRLLGNVIVLKSSDKIRILQPNYFKELSKLVFEFNETHFQSVIDYVMLQNIPVLLNKLKSDYFTDALTSKLVSYLTEIQYPREKPRWLKCVRDVAKIFSSVLAAEYAHRYYDTAKVVKSVDEMATVITDTFDKHLNSVLWLDDASKAKAKLKLKKMTGHYLYPSWANDSTSVEDHYRDLEISQDHTMNIINYYRFRDQRTFYKLNSTADIFDDWGVNPLEVNAFYFYKSNCFYINAGILQPPIFDADRLYAMNFGGIGSVIGHEITHGFDLMGVKFNSAGNLDNWLTPGTKHAFAEKRECFIDQYSKFKLTAQDLPSLMFHSELQVNGEITASENIADNVGLQQAFWAYQNWKVKNGPEILPDVLQNFTAEQIFFISFSQHWCTKYSNSEDLTKSVATSKHSPSKFRVLGSVANFEEFDKAFNCPTKPHKRVCDIW